VFTDRFTVLREGPPAAAGIVSRKAGKRDEEEEPENQGNGTASGDSAETGKDRSGSPWIVIPSTR
jgi:hypothetical protein